MQFGHCLPAAFKDILFSCLEIYNDGVYLPSATEQEVITKVESVPKTSSAFRNK